jgi:carbohydrate kinase (thermoresistant glucokinase family)
LRSPRRLAEWRAVSAILPRFLLLTGVAGSGKTTTGKRVAAAMQWPYFEADDFHPAANRTKMGSGIPLTDDDRAPWLAAIRAKMDEVRAAGGQAVFTCSALKEKYRAVLTGGCDDVLLVFLHGDFQLIHERVSRRKSHFMKPEMVRSQFAALEPPRDALALDVSQPPEVVLQQILAALRG